MAKIIETLCLGVTNYPLPATTLERVALSRGLLLADEATEEILTSESYRLAEADIKMWVATAPNVSQGGLSFDMTEWTRDLMKKQAEAIYLEYGQTGVELSTIE